MNEIELLQNVVIACYLAYPFLALIFRLLSRVWDIFDILDNPESFVGGWVLAPVFIGMLCFIIVCSAIQGIGVAVFYLIERIAGNENR